MGESHTSSYYREAKNDSIGIIIARQTVGNI